jgi:hypothetical protein
MRDTDYTSLRREFLGVGLTGAMVGLAGCADSVTVETGSDDDTEDPDSGDGSTEESDSGNVNIASAKLSFEYAAEEQQVTIEFVGGANIQAGDVRIQQGSETQVSWAELGSTTSNPEQNISPGATAVLGENILNWGQPVAEDDLIRVVYTGGETPATLERYLPPESTDSESTVPASISGFTLESSGEQQLEVSFDSSKQLGTIEVDITEAESATLTRTDFTETASGDGGFTYSASYEASSDGSYSAEITQAADTDGTNALNGENISDTAGINTQEQPSDTTPPSISAFSIANPLEQQLRVSFESNEELASIRVSITGSESKTLSESDFFETESDGGTYRYEATYQASSDGEYTAALEEAADQAGNDGAIDDSVSITVSSQLSFRDEFADGELGESWEVLRNISSDIEELDGNEVLKLGPLTSSTEQEHNNKESNNIIASELSSSVEEALLTGAFRQDENYENISTFIALQDTSSTEWIGAGCEADGTPQLRHYDGSGDSPYVIHRNNEGHTADSGYDNTATSLRGTSGFHQVEINLDGPNQSATISFINSSGNVMKEKQFSIETGSFDRVIIHNGRESGSGSSYIDRVDLQESQ